MPKNVREDEPMRLPVWVKVVITVIYIIGFLTTAVLPSRRDIEILKDLPTDEN